MIKLPANKPYLNLERHLDAYVERWPDDDEFDRARSRLGLPIYRKLLASSVSALEHALQERLNEIACTTRLLALGAPSRPATEAEAAQLQALLRLCKRAKGCDPKLKLIGVLNEEFVSFGHRKVIVFTEFRETQRWVQCEFERLGADVACINGEQPEQLKRAAIERFESEADVLVSTEAGAEGFNVQSECEIVVNIDLPWNPMHLEQRVGRVYRLGQGQRAIAINAMVESWYNDHVLARSRRRAAIIAEDLSSFRAEFDDAYVDRLFGQSSRLGRIRSLLRSASGHIEVRDGPRIDAALRRARSH